MATGLCRYDALATTLAFLDGVFLTEPLDTCDEPAAFEVTLVREGDAITVEVHVHACRAHDSLIALAEGYVGSRKLRIQPT